MPLFNDILYNVFPVKLNVSPEKLNDGPVNAGLDCDVDDEE